MLALSSCILKESIHPGKPNRVKRGYKDVQDIINAIINHPEYKGQKHYTLVRCTSASEKHGSKRAAASGLHGLFLIALWEILSPSEFVEKYL